MRCNPNPLCSRAWPILYCHSQWRHPTSPPRPPFILPSLPSCPSPYHTLHSLHHAHSPPSIPNANAIFHDRLAQSPPRLSPPMFKSNKSNTKSTQNNPAPAPAYAFSQPNTAHSSSSAARQRELETFYQPLPTPSAQSQSQSQPQTQNRGQGQRQGASTPVNRSQPTSTRYNNPFSDPASSSRPESPGFYPPRTPSPSGPNASSALLSGHGNNQSPSSGARSNGNDMPAPTRSYAPRQGGMPARGDSQAALLDNRQVSDDTSRVSLRSLSMSRRVL